MGVCVWLDAFAYGQAKHLISLLNRSCRAPITRLGKLSVASSSPLPFIGSETWTHASVTVSACIGLRVAHVWFRDTRHVREKNGTRRVGRRLGSRRVTLDQTRASRRTPGESRTPSAASGSQVCAGRTTRTRPCVFHTHKKRIFFWKMLLDTNFSDVVRVV